MEKVGEHLTGSKRRGERVLEGLRDIRREFTGVVRSDNRLFLKVQSCDFVGPRVSEVRQVARQDRFETRHTG